MLIHQVYFAFIATYCFGIIFNIKGSKLLFTSFAGSIGWTTFLMTQQMGSSSTQSYFYSAVTLSIFSELGARYLKTPVTSILICGLIPLVPGGGMYYTMYSAIKTEPLEAFNKGVATFSAAGALAMGIVFVTSMTKAVKVSQEKIRKDKENE